VTPPSAVRGCISSPQSWIMHGRLAASTTMKI